MTSRKGFTLVELLATLTVMAIMAAILFPFLANYGKQATMNSNMRSLRLLQDAMDRYRASNLENLSWTLGSDTIAASVDGVAYTNLTGVQVSNILNDITTSSNRTIRIFSEGLTSNHIKLVTSGSNIASGYWSVVWFRRDTNANAMIVNRKKQEIIGGWNTYGPLAISNAFRND
ncbi:MAG: type II secretion system protein [Verrucomicrobiota bacterium]